MSEAWFKCNGLRFCQLVQALNVAAVKYKPVRGGELIPICRIFNARNQICSDIMDSSPGSSLTSQSYTGTSSCGYRIGSLVRELKDGDLLVRQWETRDDETVNHRSKREERERKIIIDSLSETPTRKALANCPRKNHNRRNSKNKNF